MSILSKPKPSAADQAAAHVTAATSFFATAHQRLSQAVDLLGLSAIEHDTHAVDHEAAALAHREAAAATRVEREATAKVRDKLAELVL